MSKHGHQVRLKQDRLKVVHVVLQLDTGGMEKLLVEFARHADRDRFDLHFLSLTTRGRIADELESLGWPVEALGIRPGLRPGVVLRLARRFRQLRADVVHAHNTKPLIYAAPAARLARASRVIYTRHGQRHGATRGQNLLFSLVSRCADRMVCVSDDSAGLSLAAGVPARRVCRIWNGIDVRRFSFAGPAPDGPVVMVGRLSPEKNVATLIRAAARVVSKNPEAHFEIAGDGSEMHALRALASDLGIASNVRFLGDVRDVASVLGRASMFVLPSLTEGVSLTLLEAMARGIPVVATRVGGNPEVVEEGETGLLVPPSDPVTLADGIETLLADFERRRRMGTAGRRRVERLFDVRRMVESYEDLYRGSRVGQPPEPVIGELPGLTGVSQV